MPIFEWYNFDNRANYSRTEIYISRAGYPLTTLRLGETREKEYDWTDAIVTPEDMESNEKGATYLYVLPSMKSVVVLFTGKKTSSGLYKMWDGQNFYDVSTTSLRYPEPHVLCPPAGKDKWGTQSVVINEFHVSTREQEAASFRRGMGGLCL